MAEARIDLKVYGSAAIKEATKNILDLGVANERLDKIYDSVASAEARRIKEVDKLSALQKKLAKEVEAGTMSEQRANRVMDQAVRGALEKIHTDQRLIKQEKEKRKQAAIAQRDAAKEVETNNRLRAQYDQLYAADVRRKQAREELTRAVKAGMSEELANQRLEELTNDYNAWIAAVESGDYAMINSGNQFARFNDSVFRAQQRMKRFASVGLQQAGYQIQDFIVQVSAGQSALVAFGQQGSQLAGIIPGHWGAITGAILAGASAAILALQALNGEAKTVKENFDNMAQAFNDFTGAMDQASAPDFFDDFQSFAETAERALKAIQGLAKAQIDDSIRQVMGGEVKRVSSYSRQQGKNVERFTTGDMSTAAGLLGVGVVTKDDVALVNQYLNLLSGFQQAQGFENQARAADELNKFLVANVDLNKLDKTQRENVVALMERTLDLAKQAAEPEKKAAEQAKIAYGAKLQAALDLFDAEQALLQAQYADDKQKAEEAAEYAKQLRMQLMQATIDSHMQAYEAETALGQAALKDYQDKQQKKREADKELAEKRIEDAGREAEVMAELQAGVQEDLAAVAKYQEESFNKFLEKVKEAEGDMEKLSKIDIASGINAAAIEASNLSESMKKALMDALGIVKLAKDATSLDPFGGEGDKYYSTSRTIFPSWESSEKKKRGGGKSDAQKLEEYLTKAQEIADLKLAQVPLTEEEGRLLELQNMYKKAGIEVDNERIQKLVETEEALRKATEAEKQRETMMQNIENTIMNGFMAMVDGSQSVEDAFKSMLRNILLEIYKQKVAEPIAKGIGGFIGKIFGFSNGGAFMGGRVIPFANGGVVSSPTLFPMSGATGLMGEAGPEAIMPLKRGPDGKLGVQVNGGGEAPVVINQTFNFSANGDESVKKIIAQAAPQIAQMAETRVINSRRRGGQMKATFG